VLQFKITGNLPETLSMGKRRGWIRTFIKIWVVEHREKREVLVGDCSQKIAAEVFVIHPLYCLLDTNTFLIFWLD
jgi:hypothetical protein